MDRVMNMSSTTDRHSSLKLHLFSTQHSILRRPLQGGLVKWNSGHSFVASLIVFILIFGVLVIFVCLILKYLGGHWNEYTTVEHATANETAHLIPQKAISSAYASFEEDGEDPESPNYNISSSSDDLYDGKICIICYDEQRNCFFLPCGHCVTCQVCARRIIGEESRTCPVCRRFIHRVKKLFTPRKQTAG